MEVRHRFSPVGDGAIGIGRGNALKSGEGAVVPERVQERNAAVEVGSDGGGAGDMEVDGSELGWRRGLGRLSSCGGCLSTGVRLQQQESSEQGCAEIC